MLISSWRSSGHYFLEGNISSKSCLRFVQNLTSWEIWHLYLFFLQTFFYWCNACEFIVLSNFSLFYLTIWCLKQPNIAPWILLIIADWVAHYMGLIHIFLTLITHGNIWLCNFDFDFFFPGRDVYIMERTNSGWESSSLQEEGMALSCRWGVRGKFILCRKGLTERKLYFSMKFEDHGWCSLCSHLW